MQFISIFINKIFCTIFFASTIFSQDIFYSDDIVIGNLKRREVLPLAQINNPFAFRRRRFFNTYTTDADLKYRKSKDIRDPPPPDRTFELTESQIREAKIAENKENMDELQNEMRWLAIDADQRLDHLPNAMYIDRQ